MKLDAGGSLHDIIVQGIRGDREGVGRGAGAKGVVRVTGNQPSKALQINPSAVLYCIGRGDKIWRRTLP